MPWWAEALLALGAALGGAGTGVWINSLVKLKSKRKLRWMVSREGTTSTAIVIKVKSTRTYDYMMDRAEIKIATIQIGMPIGDTEWMKAMAEAEERAYAVAQKLNAAEAAEREF